MTGGRILGLVMLGANGWPGIPMASFQAYTGLARSAPQYSVHIVPRRRQPTTEQVPARILCIWEMRKNAPGATGGFNSFVDELGFLEGRCRKCSLQVLAFIRDFGTGMGRPCTCVQGRYRDKYCVYNDGRGKRHGRDQPRRGMINAAKITGTKTEKRPKKKLPVLGRRLRR